MPTAIHQITAGFANGDAISNEAKVLRETFRSWGFASQIYCEQQRTLPELRKDIRDLSHLPGDVQPDDVVLLHLSIGSDANLRFAELKCRKVIRYHNVTPPMYFRALNENIANQLAKGREHVEQLAGVADVNTAVSGYNAGELEAVGYTDVKVIPLVLDLDRLTEKPDRKVLQEMSDGTTKILFVGRMAPNKCIEDLLSAFYYYQKYVNPNSRFVHVGSFAGVEQYLALMESKKRELNLRDAGFYGSVPEAHLRAYYQSADLFLSMSEHEGFCIPLMEAMNVGVPVLAFDSSAISETMDHAGVLFKEKNFEAISEMMGRMTGDIELRKAIVAGQHERVQRYKQRDLSAELKAVLQPLLHDY